VHYHPEIAVAFLEHAFNVDEIVLFLARYANTELVLLNWQNEIFDGLLIFILKFVDFIFFD